MAKNRQLAAKFERAKRERRAYAQEQSLRDIVAPCNDVIVIKAEHVGWRNTVRRVVKTVDTSRKSIAATHW